MNLECNLGGAERCHIWGKPNITLSPLIITYKHKLRLKFNALLRALIVAIQPSSLSSHATLMMNQMDVDPHKQEQEVDELEDEDGFASDGDGNNEIHDLALNNPSADLLTTHQLHGT